MSESEECSLIYMFIHSVANNVMSPLCLSHDFRNIVLIIKQIIHNLGVSPTPQREKF